jgi:hypothetical protein
VTEFRRLVFAVCRVLLKRASFIPSWGQFACACEQEAATRGWRDGELHWKALKRGCIVYTLAVRKSKTKILDKT